MSHLISRRPSPVKSLFAMALLVPVLGLVTGNKTALAEEMNVTVVAGHPPVFRWVKHMSETFIPAVNAALEGSEYKINWDEQYGGSLAKVGDALEAIEEGLAEVGICLLYTSPSPRDKRQSRMPSSA